MRRKKKTSYRRMLALVIGLLVCEFAIIITGLRILQATSVSAEVIPTPEPITDFVQLQSYDNADNSLTTTNIESVIPPVEEDIIEVPYATVINHKTWSNGNSGAEYVEPILFVTDVGGGSGNIVVIYDEEPDFTLLGVQDITLLLIDTLNPENVTEITAVLEIMAEGKQPKIENVKDITAYLGDSPILDKNIIITGSSSGDLRLIPDISYVDFDVPGTYSIIYRAKDGETCVASHIANINVKPRPIPYEDLSSEELALVDELNPLIDTILENIIKDGMTQEEILQAVYRWGKNNVAYVGTSDKTSWVNEAITGIKRKRGDCFTYFSVAKAMLTRLGIENIDVIKSDTSRSSHFWSMINVGDGWYHFDSTPRHDKSEFFMLTDEELLAYSVENRNTHIFDQTLYPPTPYREDNQA